MNIGIIGTAGRDNNAASIDKDFYSHILQVVQRIKRLDETTLVSGGAALSDHLAVHSFALKRCAGLILHLPCEWDHVKRQYKDTGEVSWKKNPGGTSNYYHRKFSKGIGESENYSLNQIDAAINMGATIHVGSGFFDRNSKIAEDSDMLLAFTFGEGPYVADGGTRDTFLKFKRLKPQSGAYHYNLRERRIYLAE